MKAFFLYYSLLYHHKSGSLTEPTVSVMLASQRAFRIPVLLPSNAGVRST